MPDSVVIKLRMKREEARRLARLARRRRTTKSEVIREGFRMIERMENRREAVEGLIRMIKGPEPKKIRFSLK